MCILQFTGSSSYYNTQSSHRSFTDLVNSAGPGAEQTSLLNTEIIKEALTNDSLTNLDLNTGTISNYPLFN